MKDYDKWKEQETILIIQIQTMENRLEEKKRELYVLQDKMENYL